MYVLILGIIVVNLLLLMLTFNGKYLHAAKPQSTPKPSKPKPGSSKPGSTKPGGSKPGSTKPGGTKPGGSKPGSSSKPGGRPDISKLSIDGKPPTTSRLQNAINFFKKYPDRVTNPPDAYKGLIEAGYIKKTGNNWTVNTSPAGKPPARILGGSTGGSGGGSTSRLPKPKDPTTFHNNSYGQQSSGNRLPDTSVKNESGYVVTDPGNLVWQNGGRGCSGVCSMLDSKDAATVKKTIDQVTKNGGVPIGYMSLTIEPTREDIKGLKKGTDYTSGFMEGWDEHAPKLTPAYVNLMKKRIDLYAQAGFKAMEFDNIDIIGDSKVGKQIGATPQQWQGFVKDLVKYANSKGIGVVQKNTPPGWGKDMNNLFVGAIVETKPSQGKSAYEWNQIQNMLEQGKPVLLNNENGNCESVLNKVRSWTGGTERDNLIMGCKNK